MRTHANAKFEVIAKLIMCTRALFCEQEPPAPGVFAQNPPLWSLRPSLTVGMTKIPKIPGLFYYYFCWNLRNLPAESSSGTLASFTGRFMAGLFRWGDLLLVDDRKKGVDDRNM